MSKASAVIRIPAGRRTKWAVLVFWLIVVAVLGPLAGKLTGAESYVAGRDREKRSTGTRPRRRRLAAARAA